MKTKKSFFLVEIDKRESKKKLATKIIIKFGKICDSHKVSASSKFEIRFFFFCGRLEKFEIEKPHRFFRKIKFFSLPEKKCIIKISSKRKIFKLFSL